MQLYKLPALVVVSWLLAVSAFADTLIFVPQPASIGGDNDWFNSVNWFTTDGSGSLVPAGRVPLADETAIVTGTVDLQEGGIRVQTLVATNNAVITNGTVAVETLQLLTGSSINSAKVNVLKGLFVGGTNCTLNATTLGIAGFATGSLQPVPPASETSLVLTQASILRIGGVLSLTDHSRVTGGGVPQSTVEIQQAGFLLSTNTAEIRGAVAGHLIVDNSGTVIVNGGTLSFQDGIDWKSSFSSEEFRAGGLGSTILFSSAFRLDSGVTCLFTGDGTNRWLAGASVDGVVQVSSMDPTTQLAGPGHLEILDSVSGSGTVHVLGSTNQGGVLNWVGGVFALPSMGVDSGAILQIGGVAGSSCKLAGSVITNQGLCTFWGGNLDFSQAAVIQNLSNATFQVQSDGSFSSSGGGGVLNNAGTFQKISAGTMQFGLTNSTPGPDFNNIGLLDLRAGQLNLFAGASTGEFHAAPGTVLSFWGGRHVLNPGTSFTGDGAVRLLQGVGPATWSVNDALSIARLEIGAKGTLDASGAPPGKPIQITNLVCHDDALVTNGEFQVRSLQILNQGSVDRAIIAISVDLTIAGTNCWLQGATLQLSPGAFAVLRPANPGEGAVLNLTQGAALLNAGQLMLADGAVIAGGSSPPSRLVVAPGAILSTTNSALIRGQTNALLLVDNSGLIRAESGELTFADGLDWASSGGAGEFQATAPDALLLYPGSFRVKTGSTSVFTGSGTNRWLGNMVVDGIAQVGGAVPGSPIFHSGNVEIAGSVSGAGSVHVAGGSPQSGWLAWRSGTAQLARIEVDAGATLEIGGLTNAQRQLAGCTLNNSGVCTIRDGDLLLAQGATVNNLAAATLLLQTNVSLTLSPAGGSATLNNAGSLLNSLGNGINHIGADLNNSGRMEVLGGILAIQGGLKQTQGTTIIDSGATLSGVEFNLQGGTVIGSGTVDANLVNTGGTVSPGDAVGMISTGSGENYQQEASGNLLVEIGGTSPGVAYDRLVVAGSASLGGQLQLSFVNGFLPQPGQVFQVLSCGSLAGRFAVLSSPATAGLVWVPRYDAVGVSLVLASDVTLARPYVSGGELNLPVNTTPGLNYSVQATDELNPAHWQTVSTTTGDGTVKTISAPMTQGHRFYRVLLQ